MLENPKRPGPNYYEGCTHLKIAKTGGLKTKTQYITDKSGSKEYYTLTDEDKKWAKKLKLNALYLSIGASLSASMLVTLC